MKTHLQPITARATVKVKKSGDCGCGSPAKQTAKQKANLPKEIVDAIAAKQGKAAPAKNYKKGYYGK
jgi:hypothetical protein